MITVRHIERLYCDHQHRRLYRELIAGRPEATFALEPVLSRPVAVAALGMLRLDELSQSHGSLYRRLLNVVLLGQQADGGWGDPMTSAVCLRALLSGAAPASTPAGGASTPGGVAIDRGLAYLANLQQPQGTWPRESLRRMPMDEFASAFILLQLGDRAPFRRRVRFAEACQFFATHAKALEPDTRRLWTHASTRCRVTASDSGQPAQQASLFAPAA